jgi:fructuronate reductase
MNLHPRLSSETAGDLAPLYDRSAPPTIAHLGVGAFARAHLGAYADDLLRAGYPALIRGVSLRSSRAEEQLAPQDGLYTLTEREPGVDTAPRVLGALAAMMTGRNAAVDAIAAPTTTLVTLTVTEKAYAPAAAPAVVAEGLARRDRHLPAPIVASLDNLLDNGAVLRRQVLAAAERVDADLARWVAEEVRFPRSVVDRMVPATTPADLDEVARRLGLRDDAAVVAERHCSWVLEAVEGLPPLGDVGVDVVADIGPYQRRKLWLLNLPHSAFAYGGLLAGCETIAQAAADPTVAAFVAGLVDDVLAVADVPGAGAFADDAIRRFANPALGHACLQVGADGSQKLPQRLLPVVAVRRARGLPTDRFAVVVALWSAAVSGIPLAGRALPTPEDPATALVDADPVFVAEVRSTLDALQRRGLEVLREEP